MSLLIITINKDIPKRLKLSHHDDQKCQGSHHHHQSVTKTFIRDIFFMRNKRDAATIRCNMFLLVQQILDALISVPPCVEHPEKYFLYSYIIL